MFFMHIGHFYIEKILKKLLENLTFNPDESYTNNRVYETFVRLKSGFKHSLLKGLFLA